MMPFTMLSGLSQVAANVLPCCVYLYYPLTRRKGLDVDEITIDASANWTAVDKPQDLKDEEGRFILVKIM